MVLTRAARRRNAAAAARQREAEGPPDGDGGRTRGGTGVQRSESPPFPAWYQNQRPRACDGRSVTAGPHRIPGMPWYYYLLPKLTRQQQMRVVKAPPDPDSDDELPALARRSALHTETINIWSHLIPWVLYQYNTYLVFFGSDPAASPVING